MMRLTAVFAAVVLTACASGPAPQSSTVVRTRAPFNYEATVASYFDLTVPDPRNERKLVFGPPEASPCAMQGSAGAHLRWGGPGGDDTPPQPPRSNVGKAGAPPPPPAPGPAEEGPTPQAGGPPQAESQGQG